MKKVKPLILALALTLTSCAVQNSETKRTPFPEEQKKEAKRVVREVAIIIIAAAIRAVIR